MALIYSLVATAVDRPAVLAEYTPDVGNFQTITRLLLPRLAPKQSRMSYTYDNAYTFHYISKSQYIFLVLTDHQCMLQTAYGYLEEVASIFLQAVQDEEPRTRPTIALSLNEAFSPVLRETMVKWNTNATGGQFEKVRSQIDDIQSTMIRSIDNLLSRGQRIELLVERAEQLNMDTVEFQRNATSLERRMWWQEKRCQLFSLLLSFVLILFGLWMLWPR
eukprot:Lankesteria_metandrocarpae@DN474_c0_g1_i1.p1